MKGYWEVFAEKLAAMHAADVSDSYGFQHTPGHSWQEVAQGKRPLCFSGMMTAAKVMALTGAELLESPEKVAEMRREFAKAMEGKTYVCPIPEDMKPGNSEI